MVLVDSNLDKIRCTKLASWKEDFEGRLDFLGISYLEVSNEEECAISKCVVTHEDGKCLAIRVEVLSWILSWEGNPFEVQDSGPCFLKVWRESFSFKTWWKVKKNFLEDEKIAFTLNSWFRVGLFFNAEGSAHDSIDSAVRILGKGVSVCFTFELDTLFHAEGLGEVK